jgi:outer membrane protein assembly factor BamA
MKTPARLFATVFLAMLSVEARADNTWEAGLNLYQGQVIKKITIVRKNVFDDILTNHPHFYYRWANDIHIVTKECVVRRELLFAVGDTLNLERVIESERNLRLGQFIGEVYVRADPESSGSGIDLTVTATDLWTTKAETSLDLGGGKYSIGFAATEGNFMGWGKYIQLTAQTGNDQKGYEGFYSDDRLLGTRLGIDFHYSRYTYDKVVALHFRRPQYSLAVPYAFAVNYIKRNSRLRLFNDGSEYFRYKHDMRFIDAQGIYSLGESRRLNLLTGYTFEDNNYSPDIAGAPLNSVIPDDETMAFPSIGIGGQVIRYGIERYLDLAGSPEDLTYGAFLTYTIGHSLKNLGANYLGWYNSISGQFLANPIGRLFVGGIDRVTWWGHDGRSQRIRHRFETVLYYKTGPTQVLALNAMTDFAWRQMPTYQVILGGNNGLRGFSSFELAGTKLAMGNVEYRFYLPVTILTVKLGGAAFFDCGNVWQSGQRIDLGQLKSDIGFGLRFGLTKSATSRVLRLDFARALTQPGFFISFGSGTVFNLNFTNFNE